MRANLQAARIPLSRQANRLCYATSGHTYPERFCRIGILDVCHIAALQAMYVIAILVATCADVAIAARALLQKYLSTGCRLSQFHRVLLDPVFDRLTGC